MAAAIIYLIVQSAIGVGAAFGSWRLIRLTSRAFREQKTIKGVGFSLLSLLVVIVAAFFILAVVGGIMLLL